MAPQDALQSLETMEREGGAKMMAGLAAEHGEKKSAVINASGLKALRAASSVTPKKWVGAWLSDRTD